MGPDEISVTGAFFRHIFSDLRRVYRWKKALVINLAGAGPAAISLEQGFGQVVAS
jgi:hypothetical protein